MSIYLLHTNVFMHNYRIDDVSKLVNIASKHVNIVSKCMKIMSKCVNIVRVNVASCDHGRASFLCVR